ncbi:hypothetical protein [Streptomyces sp. rh34]|nr:hypothetical protein [Streptomyces sp. rh34]
MEKGTELAERIRSAGEVSAARGTCSGLRRTPPPPRACLLYTSRCV